MLKRNEVIKANCEADNVHQPNVLIQAQRYDVNRPHLPGHRRETQYACPNAVGILLQSSARETATQTLHMVTRTRPQRMSAGPPLPSALLRDWPAVLHVPRTMKDRKNKLKLLNLRLRV